MIEERAIVIRTDKALSNHVIIQTQRKSACDSCNLKSGCGTSSLAKLSGNKSFELSVENTLSASVGDVVIVSIPEEGLLKASLVMFLMPLVLMAFFAVICRVFLSVSDIASILAGGIGLFLGFYFARRFGEKNRQNPDFSPRMTALALKNDPEAICQSALS